MGAKALLGQISVRISAVRVNIITAGLTRSVKSCCSPPRPRYRLARQAANILHLIRRADLRLAHGCLRSRSEPLAAFDGPATEAQIFRTVSQRSGPRGSLRHKLATALAPRPRCPLPAQGGRHGCDRAG